jgi:amidohydrolase
MADTDLGSIIDRLAPELIELRRTLHANPEPSWEEHQTTALLSNRLTAAGLSPRIASVGTGVVCDVGSSGPLVAIRGDIDALRLPDLKDVPYRSTVPGVCHACGHDLHTTAALGAALALHEVLTAHEGSGRVRVILQPAEEAIPSGAPALVADGVMDDVRAIFGLHVDPTHEVGTVAVSSGAITSTADQLRITVRGPGGHTGRPHLSVDLAHLAGRIVVELPAALSRLTDARDGVNLTFGSIQVGDAPNVIATEAVLLASLRTTGRGAWEVAPPILRRVLAGIIEPFGATWELDHARGAPPIINDPWAVGVVQRAAAPIVGADNVVPTTQSGGGEDFSWYGEHAPMGYVRLGIRHPDGPRVDIHSSHFDLDERAIAIGAHVLAASALGGIADLAVHS